MKYLKLYENFDFEETWVQDDEIPIDYDDGNIHPYTLVKTEYNSYYYYITVIITFENDKLAYLYEDPPDIGYDDLFDITGLRKLDSEDFRVLISGKKLVTNGLSDDEEDYKSYTWDELYKVLTPSYRKYINDNYRNILHEYNKPIYESFDLEETWIQDEYKFEKGDIVKCKNPYEAYYYIINDDINSLNKNYDKKYWKLRASPPPKDQVIDIGMLNGIDVIKLKGHWPWFKAECFELSK